MSRAIHGCTPRVRKKFPETHSPLRVSAAACDPVLRTPSGALPACSAPRSVNSGVWSRNILYASHENNAKSPSFPWVYPPQLQQRILSPMRQSSSGFATGSDFNITWCTSVKIAVVAPIPSASVITAVVVNPSAFRSCRSASRKSASIRPSCFVFESGWPSHAVREHLPAGSAEAIGTGGPHLPHHHHRVPHLRDGFIVANRGSPASLLAGVRFGGSFSRQRKMG